MTFKHGDRVKCTIDGIKIDDAKISIVGNGRPYICQNQRNGEDTDEKLGYKYSYVIKRDFTQSGLTDLRHVEKTFDHPEIGDEYKDKDGDSYWVLGVCGRVIFLSSHNDKNSYDYGYVKEELIKDGWTIAQDKVEEKITTLTMDEVAKLAGVPVEQLKIVKE